MFYDVFKTLCDKKGVSVTKATVDIGLSRTIGTKWKNTAATPQGETLNRIADYFGVTTDYLLGNETTKKAPFSIWDDPNIIPYVRGRRLPILGSIPAGVPILSEQNIEGYDYADVPEGEDYFFLRVKGDSMINAGISADDLVLIKQQPCAENGNIVACIINGDEATLKRFFQQKDMIVLQPENAAYAPIIVPCKDFEGGYAKIVGVATEVKRKLNL